jgi:hypothetical protein
MIFNLGWTHDPQGNGLEMGGTVFQGEPKGMMAVEGKTLTKE